MSLLPWFLRFSDGVPEVVLDPSETKRWGGMQVGSKKRFAVCLLGMTSMEYRPFGHLAEPKDNSEIRNYERRYF